MQISEQNVFIKPPPWDFSPGLSSHVGGLGLAVKPEKWKKIKLENERG